MSPPERLSAEEIQAGLADVTIGREIIVQTETTSTNDCIWQLAKTGAEEGIVVFAEHQTAGRGQRGNIWQSAPGKGLLFSILLRPGLHPKNSSRLAEWGATTAASALRGFGISAAVRLPNDVYVSNRKVAGVLVEMRASGREHVAILGLGINVNQRAEDFSPQLRERATSLAMILGREIDRRSLAVALLRDFDRSYRKLF